jgi:hypothetical protein
VSEERTGGELEEVADGPAGVCTARRRSNSELTAR